MAVRTNRLLYGLPAVLFALLAVSFYLALRSGEQALPSTLMGKEPRPFDVAVLTDAGVVDATARLANADLKTGRVTVVNFWASWCGPCEIEHPQLMALSAEAGIAVYGIAYKDKAADAAAFLAEHGNPFERVGLDDAGRVGVDWGITGVPETFVLDRTGRVVFKVVGPLMPSDLKDGVLPAIAAASSK